HNFRSMATKREKRLNLWLNDLEYEKLVKYAHSKKLTMSEVIRDFVKSLPSATSLFIPTPLSLLGGNFRGSR
ncbi:hypothetical protein, partial [Gloeocapsa sp. PCC 73106]|uniref:hypothetical protein n=1 Tax=Gloeocapsa sp. PCC 73106 TaxID=102232 RepID=UPI00054CE4DD